MTPPKARQTISDAAPPFLKRLSCGQPVFQITSGSYGDIVGQAPNEGPALKSCTRPAREWTMSASPQGGSCTDAQSSFIEVGLCLRRKRPHDGPRRRALLSAATPAAENRRVPDPSRRARRIGSRVTAVAAVGKNAPRAADIRSAETRPLEPGVAMDS